MTTTTTVYEVEPPFGPADVRPEWTRTTERLWLSGVKMMPSLSRGDRITIMGTRYTVLSVEWDISVEDGTTYHAVKFYVTLEKKP